MKTKIKLTQLLIILFFVSCSKNHETKSQNLGLIKNKNTQNSIIQNSELKADTIKSYNEEINENDEYISSSLFKNWKGKYILKQESVMDGYGRESISFSELYMIRPDSCILKSWLSDEEGNRYKQNDNYQEYIGGIYATENKDSIEFYTKKVIVGGNNSLSPLLTLSKNGRNFFIYSLLTSPSHNGIVKMEILKVKKQEKRNKKKIIIINTCEIQQFIFFIGYLENTSGLIDAMKNKQWERIASLYNGSAWKSHNPDYADNIKRYYNEFSN